MKKVLVLILTIAFCFLFAACSNDNAQEETTEPTTTTTTTTTEPVEKTTAQPSENTAKGNELKEAVLNALENQNGAEISGDLKYGSFTYKFTRDPEIMYAYEQTEEFETKARDNAQKLIESIEVFYGDEITFDREYAYSIGGGDNGLDSVQYQFFYLNTQNQQIKVFADSDGVISFAQCRFTW
ncbi:MAG: hypothetical protein J1E36_00185 [Eubacterium sp.]|nr:hypothetical protein [Eubacterium sp.]